MKDVCPDFVAKHIKNCEKVLKRLKDSHLTFLDEKSSFGHTKILVVGHLCGMYHKHSLQKVMVIHEMKEVCQT